VSLVVQHLAVRRTTQRGYFLLPRILHRDNWEVNAPAVVLHHGIESACAEPLAACFQSKSKTTMGQHPKDKDEQTDTYFITTYRKTIQLFDCHGCRFRSVIRHKAETTTTTSISFDHDADAEQVTIRAEQMVHVKVGKMIRNVKNE
jgi:hypothetical protein